MKIFKWHTFLLGWRDGALSYVFALLIMFVGLSQLLAGANGYMGIFTAYILSYYIFLGCKKFGLMDKWDRQEYKILKFTKE